MLKVTLREAALRASTSQHSRPTRWLIKARLYPKSKQKLSLLKSFGCAILCWNYALNACIQHYEKTAKPFKLSTYKGMLPQLKVDNSWLKEDSSSFVLQSVTINLSKAYENFLEGRAKFPQFNLKIDNQCMQYPQNVTIAGNCLKIPKIGEMKGVFHYPIKGIIRTAIISKTSIDRDFA